MHNAAQLSQKRRVGPEIETRRSLRRYQSHFNSQHEIAMERYSALAKEQ